MGGKRIYSGTKKERRQQADKKYWQSDKGKVVNKKYRRTEKGKIAHRRETKKYLQTEKGKVTKRKHALKQNYGITLEQYDEMFKKQNGICAICKKINLDGHRLSVDHNHTTGKVRSLLCNRCNFLVGAIENNKDLIKQVFKYLERAKST